MHANADSRAHLRSSPTERLVVVVSERGEGSGRGCPPHTNALAGRADDAESCADTVRRTRLEHPHSVRRLAGRPAPDFHLPRLHRLQTSSLRLTRTLQRPPGLSTPSSTPRMARSRLTTPSKLNLSSLPSPNSHGPRFPVFVLPSIPPKTLVSPVRPRSLSGGGGVVLGRLPRLEQ
ncbi:RHTO0S02e11518g1_1 [Rhodotorula toruloides]|uniref:RHTO0S02e11518g1_1 n=1 Tax=Rhodotorula toruloides TaxID=5286 RepID=A0A061AHY1_RHOTO|nr:RHTO0S02e11518g1_1 [Rhodotorula toruloides]